MARTQAADYEEKRDGIVDAATQLFAEKGFDGASLADIAAACDMSKSLFYHYYPSKEALLYAVMRGHMDELLTAIAVTPRVDPELELRDFARRLMRLYAGAASAQKVLLYELARLPAAQRRDIVAKERRLVAYVEEILTRARPRQQRHSLKAQAMLFFGMLNWTHTWLKTGGAISRDEIADMAARTILAAR
jgi:AcrR family transcriptional regulator